MLVCTSCVIQVLDTQPVVEVHARGHLAFSSLLILVFYLFAD